jgi:glycosyltransferase involved in cell wall biosynthesis
MGGSHVFISEGFSMSDLNVLGVGRISVVVPFLGDEAVLCRCLSALSECEPAPAEIIVVDNAEEAKQLQLDVYSMNIRLLHEPEPGPGPARNTGASAATEDIIAFLDQDCEPAHGWTKIIIEAFKDPSVEIIGGQVSVTFRSCFQFSSVENYQKIFSYRNDWYIQRGGFTGTGNLAIRKSTFEKIGPFSGLDRNEERDWGKRATAAGCRIKYVHSMLVRHPEISEIEGLFSRVERECALDFLACKKRRMGLALWPFQIGLIGLYFLWAMVVVASTDRVSGIWARVLAGICRFRVDFRKMTVVLRLLFGTSPNEMIKAWREQTISRSAVEFENSGRQM